jgi:adenylate cyclase
VLPFVNSSNDPNAEYLSDGLTDGLIDRLSNIPKLRVMSHSAVFRYKGGQVDPQAVGHNLHVGALLTGRVSQHGDSLEINTELVNAEDSSHIGVSNIREAWPMLRQLKQELPKRSQIASSKLITRSQCAPCGCDLTRKTTSLLTNHCLGYRNCSR